MASQLLTKTDNFIAYGELLDRVALITGAASGIGLVISKRIFQEGALIALLDINEKNLQSAKDDLANEGNADRILTIRCDITDEDDVIHAVQTTVEQFGKLDIAINNAGVSVSVPSDECTLEEWNWVMDTNSTGVFLGTKYAIGAMKNNGELCSIVNMASIRKRLFIQISRIIKSPTFNMESIFSILMISTLTVTKWLEAESYLWEVQLVCGRQITLAVLIQSTVDR